MCRSSAAVDANISVTIAYFSAVVPGGVRQVQDYEKTRPPTHV